MSDNYIRNTESRELYRSIVDFISHCEMKGLELNIIDILKKALDTVNLERLHDVYIRYENPRYATHLDSSKYCYLQLKSSLSEHLKGEFKNCDFIIKKLTVGDPCRGPVYQYITLPSTYRVGYIEGTAEKIYDSIKSYIYTHLVVKFQYLLVYCMNY